MPPLLMAGVTSLIRALLHIAAAWLVARGVWTQADSTIYVEAAAVSIATFAWSLWANYKDHRKIATATDLAGVTLEQLDAEVKRRAMVSAAHG